MVQLNFLNYNCYKIISEFFLLPPGVVHVPPFGKHCCRWECCHRKGVRSKNMDRDLKKLTGRIRWLNFIIYRRGVQMTRRNGEAYETVLCEMRWMQLPSVKRAHRVVRWSELTERINWKGLPKQRCVLPAGARRRRREAGGRRIEGRYILRNSLMKYGICENGLLWELHKVNSWRKNTRI